MKRSGAYILLFRLGKEERVAVGRFGRVSLAGGHYAYVGSAMNGLDARVARHLRVEKRKRWHIDYLLERAVVTGVLEFESSSRQECELNARLQREASSIQPLPGFGSTDCRCHSHLHHLGRSVLSDEIIADLAARLGGVSRP